MREGRWTTVTESEFDHEHRGLEAIREKLPDADPWRAWSNFTFTAHTGHVREVDLLVVAPGGVYMIELKDWHGSVTSENGTWVQTTPGGHRRPHGNPLHLVNKKAKELASLLGQHGRRVWVGEAVCFTDGGLRVRLPAHDQNGVYTVDELVAMLKRPPRDERRRITAIDSREIKTALDRTGIRRSEAEYKVGPYQLDRKSFDSGPTWADYKAHHSELPEVARVRVYLSERGSEASIRRSVENAARREAAVLQRFKHPGVVQLKQYYPSGHAAGPALIFDYDPRTLRLDEYLLQHGKGLDILGRMALVRQLAETMRSAHSARIHHRALAAHAIHVVPRDRGRRGRAIGEDAAWLTSAAAVRASAALMSLSSFVVGHSLRILRAGRTSGIRCASIVPADRTAGPPAGAVSSVCRRHGIRLLRMGQVAGSYRGSGRSPLVRAWDSPASASRLLGARCRGLGDRRQCGGTAAGHRGVRQMPVMDGIEATRRIASDPALAGVHVVMLTNYGMDEYVFEALRAGAAGFLVKNIVPEDVLHAVRIAAPGASTRGADRTRNAKRSPWPRRACRTTRPPTAW